MTVSNYFGQEGLQPILDLADKGVIILVRTSNPGAAELQASEVKATREELEAVLPGNVALHFQGHIRFYERVAYRVSRFWNKNKNCAVVVGATAPSELARVRAIVGDDVPILIPGIGAQGGDLKEAIRAGMNSKGAGMIINSSREIIFGKKGEVRGENYAEAAGAAAKELNDAIQATIAELLEEKQKTLQPA
jgi:orotidine-5'-phosphate decarboxylase